jgi:hypothetical protein
VVQTFWKLGEVLHAAKTSETLAQYGPGFVIGAEVSPQQLSILHNAVCSEKAAVLRLRFLITYCSEGGQANWGRFARATLVKQDDTE